MIWHKSIIMFFKLQCKACLCVWILRRYCLQQDLISTKQIPRVAKQLRDKKITRNMATCKSIILLATDRGPWLALILRLPKSCALSIFDSKFFFRCLQVHHPFSTRERSLAYTNFDAAKNFALSPFLLVKVCSDTCKSIINFNTSKVGVFGLHYFSSWQKNNGV